MCITMGPYKRPENLHLGFAWIDIIRPFGCDSCGWYGTGAPFDPKRNKFQCPKCSSHSVTCFPGIEPDMLQ